MPDQIAIHWNISGEADGYGSKLVGLFLIPAIELLIIPLFLVLPRIDPKTPKEKMIKSYDWFIVVFTFSMFYMFGLSTAWNLGYRFDFMRLLVPMFGTLFIGIGYILGDIEMNWFMGVRTPWTLSSQEVWDDTHRLSGLLFKGSGVVAIFGIFFSKWIALMLAIIPVIFSGLYLVFYSYHRYRQLKRG
jgi:uncharacterized membrane protein